MAGQIWKLIMKGLGNLLANPLPQLLTLSAVTLVAFLTGLFLMGLSTFDKHLKTSRGESVYQVYWRPGTPDAELQAQWKSIEHLPGLRNMKTYTSAQALSALSERLKRSNAAAPGGAISLPSLSVENPLPPTALLTFADFDKLALEEKSGQNSEDWQAQIQKHLETMPGVERVAVTPLRDELGKVWRKASNFIFYPLVGFLFVVLGLVVGNTVRLSLAEKMQEVEILHLVGAYAWYIRLPLLTSGALLGLTGGVIALLLLFLLHFQMADALNFAPLFMTIQFLSPTMMLSLLLLPTLMGIIGSWLAVRRVI